MDTSNSFHYIHVCRFCAGSARIYVLKTRCKCFLERIDTRARLWRLARVKICTDASVDRDNITCAESCEET